MNVMFDKLVPVIRRSGSTETIRPWEITSGYDTDPVVATAYPRPDFNRAGTEFLIGLCQLYLTPKTPADHAKLTKSPPSAKVLKDAFDTKPFDLDTFLQSKSISAPISIGDLLPENPGIETVKTGRDVFTRKNRYRHLCPSCALIALYGKQTTVGMGGRGYRSSKRQSGTTGFVTLFIKGETLWETVWANVIPKSQIQGQWAGNPFPWVSGFKKDHAVAPYFETSWNMKITFQKGKTMCDVCGCETDEAAATLQKGARKKPELLPHPLCPMEELKKKTYKHRSFALGLNPKGFLVYGLEYPAVYSYLLKHEPHKKKYLPAENIAAHLANTSGDFDLWVYGGDFNQAKYRCMGERFLHIHDFRGKEKELGETLGMVAEIVSAINKTFMARQRAICPSAVSRFYKDSEEAFYRNMFDKQSFYKEAKDIVIEILNKHLCNAGPLFTKIIE